MPFPVGSVAVHDDGQHTGSAKRHTASGVVGLNAGGDIITPGNELFLNRDGSGDIYIAELTSGEPAMSLRRTGANAFVLYNNTVAGGKIVQDSSMKDVASGIAGLDANNRIPNARLPSLLRSGLIGSVAWAETSVVQGTWLGGGVAGQTDYDDLIASAPGYINNTTNNDLDEFKLSSLVLNAGTYEIKVIVEQHAGAGILEVLHGATSLGTFDTYNAAFVYNVVATFTYTPTARTSADLRFRANGKNAASANYNLRISRIQIRKTA